jgi:LysM domain
MRYQGERKCPPSPRAHRDNVIAVIRAFFIFVLAMGGLSAGLVLSFSSSAAVVKAALPKIAASLPLNVAPAKKAAPPPVHAVLTYDVSKGETLWGIADRFCGSPADWHHLYDANKKVIGTTWGLVTPGMILVIAC